MASSNIRVNGLRSADGVQSAFEMFKEGLNKTWVFLKYIIENVFLALPEGLLAGAILVGVLTHNMGLIMLAFAMVIFKVCGTGVGVFMKNTLGSLVPTRGEGVASACEFRETTLSSLNGLDGALRESAMPGRGVFFVAAVIFYSMFNIYKFKTELQELRKGGAQDVLYTSGIFGLLIILAYVIWRMKNGCDGKEILLLSVLLAGGIAYGVSALFETLFGRQSINLLNIPLLAEEKVAVDNVPTCASASAGSNAKA